ncbi:MAG: hypothetical protein U9O55_01525 [Patescibacteria group bacterium]|nr:hypothetical protein [Patescibacteria group bacterium]
MPINLLPKKFKEKEKKEIRKKEKLVKSVEMRVPSKSGEDENKKNERNFFSNFFYSLFFRKEKASNKIDNRGKEKFLEEKKRKEITNFLKHKKEIGIDDKEAKTKMRETKSGAGNKKTLTDKKTRSSNIKKKSFWQWFLGNKPAIDSQKSRTLSDDFDKDGKEYNMKNIKKSSEEKSFWQKGKIKEEKDFLNKHNKTTQEPGNKEEKKQEKKKNIYKKDSFWQRLFRKIGKDKGKNNSASRKSQKTKENKGNKANKRKKNAGNPDKNKKRNRFKKFFYKKAEINFIDGELIGSVRLKIKERALSIIFVLFFSLIIISSVYMLVNWYQLTVIERSRSVEKKLQDLKNNIDVFEVKKQEALKFQEKLKAVDYLLSQHICWTDFLNGIERITLRDVYYESAIVDFEGNIFLSAETDSFETVAEQLLVFQDNKDLIESVKIDSVDSENIGDSDNEIQIIKFNITLKINKENFLNIGK